MLCCISSNDETIRNCSVDIILSYKISILINTIELTTYQIMALLICALYCDNFESINPLIDWGVSHDKNSYSPPQVITN